MRQIVVDQSKCTGCGLCELACSYENEKVYNPAKSRIKVERVGMPAEAIVVACEQCIKAECVDACPLNAIAENEETGAYVVDESICTGCGLCVEACPLDIIKIHPEKEVAMKCDLCNGNPKCIGRCPTGALSLETH